MHVYRDIYYKIRKNKWSSDYMPYDWRVPFSWPLMNHSRTYAMDWKKHVLGSCCGVPFTNMD